MKPDPHQIPAPQEVELKLSLPLSDPKRVTDQLALVPVLSRRKAKHQTLHNIYYDTPDQQLRQLRAVLRLRRVTGDTGTGWVQTFKTGTSDTSALSRRGEWESPVDAAALSRHALEATPWSDLDADGRLLAALVPCFVTAFERTTWLVRQRDTSVVEVALDLGQIEAKGQVAPICELELELKSGPPSALFEIAGEIARTVAVLPFSMSKGQRGYALAQDGLNRPYRAQLPHLAKAMPVQLLAQQVLRSAFTQFTSNLAGLLGSDDPEVVHQARIGWRRFKSAQRIFKKLVPVAAPEPSGALHLLIASLGELRNLDVARTDTLPAIAEAFTMGDTQRTQSWLAMMTCLTQANDLQRTTVRQVLQRPYVGASLLVIQQWLENLSAKGQLMPRPNVSLRQWVKHRMQRLSKKLVDARKVADSQAQWHHVRILAKRLRYGTENLQDLMPRRLTKLGLQHATSLQSSIGAERDIAQLSALVEKLAMDPCVAEFLRGFIVGASQQQSVLHILRIKQPGIGNA